MNSGASLASTCKLTTSWLGRSAHANRIRTNIQQLATRDVHVLVSGETGTGKELIARLIHSTGTRANRPLVCLNCAALPDTLLESELFGYERGAFTGAHTSTVGKMEYANGGTLLLDEIGEMKLEAQAKLLRVLDHQEFYRLGGVRTVSVNVRIIAATNRKLEQLIETGAFRSDLFYRINVARIHVPPLRERPEDIVVLAEDSLQRISQRLGLDTPQLSGECKQALLTYTWPGNVRELRNVIESSLLQDSSRIIDTVHLPDWFKDNLPLIPTMNRQEEAIILASNPKKSLEQDLSRS